MAESAMSLPMSRSEFLAWEHEQLEKHEFWQGEVFAMTGARQAHVMVALNVATLLKSHLRGKPCRAYISDMQLEVEAADAVYYPDVVVSCDPADLLAERVLRRPTVVIEVLSDSTAAYDRGVKFAAYRKLSSLKEYVLIDPERRTLEIFRRTEQDDWLLVTRDAARGLVLPSLAFEAGLDAVFEDLDTLEPAAAQSDPTTPSA
ncbi:Uma2 family endonuclease [Denitratimonas sp. CY0512]|uniref:Uma2 family endonuclease n=1 Tax=Denitratimonas sp. CY0512 TaxID=3131940 RepID=UPI00309BF2B9